MKNFSKKGFTLTELLVAIAIIGILSSVILVNLNGARTKSRDKAVFVQIMSTQPIAYKCIRSGIKSPDNIHYARLRFAFPGLSYPNIPICGYMNSDETPITGFPNWPDINKISSDKVFDTDGNKTEWCNVNQSLNSLPTYCADHTDAADADTTTLADTCGGTYKYGGKFCYMFGNFDLSTLEASLSSTQKLIFCTHDGCSFCTNSGCKPGGL